MKKIVDKNYCMSSFLTFRCIVDNNKTFQEGIEQKTYKPVASENQMACITAKDIDISIRKQLENVDLSKAAILLSGGIDSAILASYMPKGMSAYTALCSAKGAVDETARASNYCKINGLKHVVVDIKWEDYLECIDKLMLNDGCPVFANEPQVYKLAKIIKNDGFDTIIFGDNADMAFGGMDKMLSKDWTYDEWVERFTFVNPDDVLNEAVSMNNVYEKYKKGVKDIDYISFINDIFSISSTGAYVNAFRLAEIKYYDPYAYMKMAEPLDLNRIRSGDSKYLLRDLFRMRYPRMEIPEKIAMARAVDQWLAGWDGPVRKEFKNANKIKNMTGEQKFLIYSLERFLNLIESE